MPRVIVTGGCGFIGSHLVDYLLDVGVEVLAFDDLSGGCRENLSNGAFFVEGSICDQKLVRDTFSSFCPNYVIHAAAFASENLSNHCAAYTANNICVGTSNIVSASVNAGVGCFVNLSSIAVYGHQIPPFAEETHLSPMDAYGAAKQYTESLCRAAHHSFGLNYVTFRPHNVIGRNQNLADSTRNVVSIFIRQALEGNPLTIYGDGTQTRAFSPVSQVAPIIASSLFNGGCWGETFNIGGEKPYSVLEIAKMVSKIVGVAENFLFLPERKEAKHAFSDHSKLRGHFGYEAGLTVEETIEEMVTETRKMNLKPIQELPPIEVAKGLPENWK